MIRSTTLVFVVLLILVVASAAFAGPQDFTWQLRAGGHHINKTRFVAGVDWVNADHPKVVLNTISGDWLDRDQHNGNNGWALTAGHRFVHERAAISLLVGATKLDGGIRSCWKIPVDYGISDNVAVSVAYLENGWQHCHESGCGFMAQVAYRF